MYSSWGGGGIQNKVWLFSHNFWIAKKPNQRWLLQPDVQIHPYLSLKLPLLLISWRSKARCLNFTVNDGRKKLSLAVMDRNQPLSPSAQGYPEHPEHCAETRDSAVKLVEKYSFYKILCICLLWEKNSARGWFLGAGWDAQWKWEPYWEVSQSPSASFSPLGQKRGKSGRAKAQELWMVWVGSPFTPVLHPRNVMTGPLSLRGGSRANITVVTLLLLRFLLSRQPSSAVFLIAKKSFSQPLAYIFGQVFRACP